MWVGNLGLKIRYYRFLNFVIKMKHEIKSIPPHIIFLYNYQNKLSNKTFQIQITMSNIFETYFIKINIDCLLFIFTYIIRRISIFKNVSIFLK